LLNERSTKETILFVDDEEFILDVANQFFTRKGYRVLTADNGRSATQILEKEKIDCCFTDINMPKMNGLELAEFIRCHDNTIPVIIMTGYPSLDNTIRTLKNGVVDFLIKPINLSQMEITVERVFRERNLFVKNMLLTKAAEGNEKLKALNDELLHKIEELHTLNHIMSDFAVVRDHSDAFKKIVGIAVELTNADEARFMIVNESLHEPVQIAAFFNSKHISTAESQTKFSCGLSTEQMDIRNNGIAELVNEVVADQKPLLLAQNAGVRGVASDIRSLMVIPLTIRDNVFGVIVVLTQKKDLTFNEKDLYYLAFMANKAAGAIENLALYENIYENLFATLYAFVKAIEAKDPYTEQHSNRVTAIAIELAKAMGCSEEDQEVLNVAGRLHDIGKIGIRDEILLKPGRLTADEYNVIKEHPVIGEEIVAHLGFWDREKQIIRCHHERYDGKGYPDGLQGKGIPLLGRILSVADVYDAIASDRAYRKKMEESKILKIMYDGAGTQFDSEVIDIFKKLYEKGIIQRINAQ
jgi:putative nucleotidyltransferase with HDIG domain